MANVTVLGSGSWGTALAVLLCNNGHDVTLWSYLQEEVDEMKRTHRNLKLNDNLLPDKLHLTADLEEATANRDLIVFAVPSFATLTLTLGFAGVPCGCIMTETLLVRWNWPADFSMRTISGE